MTVPGGARAAAVRVVERTLASRAPAESSIARESARLADERDRRLLGELAYGVLRWKLRLERVLERASGRSLTAIDPALRPVLAVAAVQIFYLDRVPAHAAVSEAVDEARRRGGAAGAGFTNAVLRKLAASPRLSDWPVEERDPVRRRAIESSHPVALVERWLDRFGAEATDRVLAADNAPRELHLLAFADRGGPSSLAAALAGEGVETAPGTIAAQALRVVAGNPLAGSAFARGDFYVQDQASQAAACVPAPAPGERVLDAAAAPGGKGLAILAREPAARVLFADRALERGLVLRDNARRLGRDLPFAVVDAARGAFAAGAFDRVVLDAPCTGTGTLRRHPELRWRFGATELARLAERGLEMLLGVCDAVAPGGRLVHVTCSIEVEENEEVVTRFRAARPEFVEDPLDEPSLETSAGRRGEGRWRVLPDLANDGFSVAVLRRRK